MTAQQEDEFRLRKASEFLTHSRDEECQARRILAQAVEQTARAKNKHEALFSEVEARTCARIKAGILPPAISGY